MFLGTLYVTVSSRNLFIKHLMHDGVWCNFDCFFFVEKKNVFNRQWEFVLLFMQNQRQFGWVVRLPFLFPGIPLYLFAGSALWEWGWWLPLFCFWVFLLVQDPSSLELEWCYFQGPPWVFLRLFFCSLRSRLSWRKYCKDLWTSLENVLRIFPRGPKEKLIKPQIIRKWQFWSNQSI